jgi:hypothetical protein
MIDLWYTKGKIRISGYINHGKSLEITAVYPKYDDDRLGYRRTPHLTLLVSVPMKNPRGAVSIFGLLAVHSTEKGR